MAGLLGRKVGMTQVFAEDTGARVPVTVVECGPCTVLEKRTEENNGYTAVQLGFLEKAERRTNAPMKGHFKKAGTTPKKFIREFRVSADELGKVEIGQELKVDLFKAGDKVNVVGTGKGRGYQGVMKRHNFSGFPATRGTHEMYRASGSVGARMFPARIQKGLGMPGHMGDNRVTMEGLKIIRVVPEKNLLIIEGALPGAKNGLLLISTQD